MIKAVIFDIGGVLQIQDVNGPLGEDVSKTFNIPVEVFESFRHKYELKLLKGEWNENQYWEKLKKVTNSDKPIPSGSLLLRQYRKNFSINSEVLQIVKEIKESGYKLACLTDTQKPHTEFNRKMGLYDDFEVQVFSHDTSMCKPNPNIYKLCLDKIGITAKKAVYIDDRESSLVPAKKLGMTTIHFLNPQRLRQSLKRLNIIDE